MSEQDKLVWEETTKSLRGDRCYQAEIGEGRPPYVIRLRVTNGKTYFIVGRGAQHYATAGSLERAKAIAEADWLKQARKPEKKLRELRRQYGAREASSYVELALRNLTTVMDALAEKLRAEPTYLDGQANEAPIRQALGRVWEALETHARMQRLKLEQQEQLAADETEQLAPSA